MKFLKTILFGLLSGFATYFLLAVFSLFISGDSVVTVQSMIMCVSIVLGSCTFLIMDAINSLKNQLIDREDIDKNK